MGKKSKPWQGKQKRENDFKSSKGSKSSPFIKPSVKPAKKGQR